jgi:hypothetical protein
MKTINGVLIAFSIILFLCCSKESDQNNEPMELRSDFSANEFKNAIIGEWKSVFENPEYENVIYLEFDDLNNSRIILQSFV